MEMTLGQLAVYLGGTLDGGGADCPVTGAAGFDQVAEGEVTYVVNDRYLAEAVATPALAIIAPLDAPEAGKPLIRVADPRAAFGKTLGLFDWRRRPLPGVDLRASVAQTAAIHATAHIGPYAVIGERAVIGEDCIISAHVIIGDQVEIGAGTVIYPHTVVYPRCTIGCRTTIHSGVVIGADGFGFNPGPNGWEKIPHLGTVIIGDDVEIGANTTVDRATTGETVIANGVKIDNLVQIGHNVKIGPRSLIIAQVGIAGSTEVEEDVIIAGQAGLRDHLHIGARAKIAAASGVARDVPADGVVSGYPAQNHTDQIRQDVNLRKLPKLLETVKELEKRVKELEAQLPERVSG